MTIARQIVFLLAPKLHLLDLAGPAQVFFTAADLGCQYRLHYVAESATIQTAQGVAVQAATEWPTLASDDLIVVPGWRSPRLLRRSAFSAETAARVRAHHGGGGMVASICSGADALGRFGLLDGRRFTSHHELSDQLAERYPAATIVRDVLYVEDDRVITSAGIASGIDLALHLVAVQHGPQSAARTARAMVVYARRNGDEQQASAMLRHRGHLSELAHRIQDLIDARFTEQLRLSDLASSIGVSERTLTRTFAEAVHLTPLRYQQALRLERAEHLIGHGATMETAARECGFTDARMLRRLRAQERGIASW